MASAIPTPPANTEGRRSGRRKLTLDDDPDYLHVQLYIEIPKLLVSRKLGWTNEISGHDYNSRAISQIPIQIELLIVQLSEDEWVSIFIANTNLHFRECFFVILSKIAIMVQRNGPESGCKDGKKSPFSIRVATLTKSR